MSNPQRPHVNLAIGDFATISPLGTASTIDAEIAAIDDHGITCYVADSGRPTMFPWAAIASITWSVNAKSAAAP